LQPIVDPRLERYAEEHSADVPDLLYRLERETQETMRSPQMLSGRTEGQFLRLLVKILSARRVLEVGTFTGYSALMMASALPEDGSLDTLEVDPAHEAVARRYFFESPHGHKIRIHMGAALETLSRLPGPFDLAFLDADKQNYPRYYERLVELLRPGGVLVVDNVLWSGRVVAPQDEETRAIDELNRRASNDPRVEPVLLTLRDGVLVARKRESTP
jgi:caffeoyl-CoA O-methyltransferase